MKIRGSARLQIGAAMLAGLAGLIAQPVSSAAQVQLPAQALGGGTMASEFAFTPSVPPAVDVSGSTITKDDNPVSLTWSILQDKGSQAALYLDDRGLFYTGGVTIMGTGASNAESITFGGGSFTVSVNGQNAFGGQLTCPALSGSYIRAGVIVEFGGGAGQGTCQIDAQSVPAQITGAGLFQTDDCTETMGNPPSTLPNYTCPYGNGIDQSVARTQFNGVWSVIGQEPSSGV